MLELLFPVAAFAEEAAAAGEHAAESGGLANMLGSVYPNPANIWPTWLAFIILFALLYKFAMPAIVSMIDARTDKIRESLEKAEETKIEAERLFEDYKAQLADARAESNKVIEQGRKVAETMKDEIVAKANDQATEIVAKAHEAMAGEMKAAQAELQAQVAELTVAIAGKLIGEKLTASDHERLIGQFVAEVGGLNDN